MSADLVVRLLGAGDCAVSHSASGATVSTSKSPQFGGSGTSFSSTDLLAAALATCIATDLEPVASRAGVPLDAIWIRARRLLGTSPRRVEAIEVDVSIAAPVDDVVLIKLKRAADTCLVQRALADSVDCRISIERAE